MQVFSGNPLDRATRERLDEEWLARSLQDDRSRFLPLWKLDVLVKSGGGLGWARRGILGHADPRTGPLLLGVLDGVSHYAVDVSGLEDPVATLGLGSAASFTDVRAAVGQVEPGEAGIVAQARALVDWHATHRFCARCGAATSTTQGGAMRRCDSCRGEHFPRVNPVVIMLVVRGDHCLLGRQAAWPRGMFSTLAGFVETGETLEEAVRREVREEAGIEVGRVAYHASQPWPFPSSLMIGCVAEAESEEITIDAHEVEDVRWFPRASVEAACRGEATPEGLFLPPGIAIGRRLCDAWVGLDP